MEEKNGNSAFKYILIAIAFTVLVIILIFVFYLIKISKSEGEIFLTNNSNDFKNWSDIDLNTNKTENRSDVKMEVTPEIFKDPVLGEEISSPATPKDSPSEYNSEGILGEEISSPATPV